MGVAGTRWNGTPGKHGWTSGRLQRGHSQLPFKVIGLRSGVKVKDSTGVASASWAARSGSSRLHANAADHCEPAFRCAEYATFCGVYSVVVAVQAGGSRRPRSRTSCSSQIVGEADRMGA